MKTSHRAILRPILLTAAAAIGLAGFLPAAPARAAEATYRIAILGDSWAAGEGVTPYVANEGDGNTGCHRSMNAWYNDVVLPSGQTVRQAYDNGTASVQFLACTGADTWDVTSTTHLNETAQVGRMFSTSTHVFLSVSGNNFNFAKILTDCAFASAATCTSIANSARSGLFPVTTDLLRSTITAIHAKAPTAEIILTGYATPVSTASFPFRETAPVIKALADDFNQRQKDVVAGLATTMNVKFADIRSTLAGHEDGMSPTWFFGVVEAGWPWRKLHPNDLAQPQIAKVVTPKVLKPFSCPTLVKSGASGECVKQIQRSLNAWNNYTTKLSFATLTIDGAFGPATLAAVKAFQKYRGLTADGIVGSATKADLFDK